MPPRRWPKPYDNRKKYIGQVASQAGLQTKFDFQTGFVLLDAEVEVITRKRTASIARDLDEFLKAIQAYISQRKS